MNSITSWCCGLMSPDDNDQASESTPLMRADSLPTYDYKSISQNEYRLLVLHPARKFSDDIVIHLKTYQRSEHKNYESVSYSWGKDKTTVPVLVYDEDCASSYLHGHHVILRMIRYHRGCGHANANLQIRSNVAVMLRYLRYQWLPRYLWIDALCINQGDKEEKSQQVTCMGDIYSRSRRTLIWLGHSNTLHPLANLEATAREVHSQYLQADKATNASYSPNLEHRSQRREATDIQNVLSLPWFSRRWVIQEVALSRRPRVIFGREWLSFEDMMYFIDQIRSLRDVEQHIPSITKSLQTLETMISLHRRHQFRIDSLWTRFKHVIYRQYYRHHPKETGAVDFVQLLVSVQSAECSDDRDRIYALNSLGGRPTVVDYQHSPEEVFIQFAIDECSHSLETLYCCGAFPSHSLPSWVPDWRCPRQWIPIKSLEARPPSTKLLSEAARLANMPCYRPNFISSHAMVVTAVPFAFVAAKGPQMHEEWVERKWSLLKRCLEFYIHSSDLSAPIGESHTFDRFMKTITAGTITSGLHLKDWLHAEDPTHFTETAPSIDAEPCCPCMDVSFCEYPSIAHPNVHNIMERVHQLLSGRCPFVTQRGDWGIGPAATLLGDQIVALPGCRYPFVMRPAQPGVSSYLFTPPASVNNQSHLFDKIAGTFRIIGDCYMTPFEGFEQLNTQCLASTVSIV